MNIDDVIATIGTYGLTNTPSTQLEMEAATIELYMRACGNSETIPVEDRKRILSAAIDRVIYLSTIGGILELAVSVLLKNTPTGFEP